MSYQALYRTYRPKTFSEVAGQEVIVKTLQNALIHDKIAHAYLFSGPRGTGKTSIAKILAKAVNCEQSPTKESCGKCPTCLAIQAGSISDVVEIDAASNNGVDEIRDLREKVKYLPSMGKYKVYIIDEVHMLSTGAFNALLKTLEEPPKHVIFILATTEP
ncbi:MAG: DNA polymerase III subunit gamma/tau, partial [Acholeplasmataceae bacterium]